MALTDKINLDFQILETLDPRVILIADSSSWGAIENKPAILEITLPGDEQFRTEYFQMKQINIWNSSHFNLSCVTEGGEMELVDLPDGIYKLTLKGSPSTYFTERYYLRTVLLEAKLDQVVINYYSGAKMDESFYKSFSNIKMLVEAAHANLRYSNITESQQCYMEANRLLDSLINCNGCASV